LGIFGNRDKYVLLCWQVKLRLLYAVSWEGVKSGGRACQRRDTNTLIIQSKMSQAGALKFKIEDEHEILDITSNNLIGELMSHIPCYKNGFIRVNPSGFVFLTETEKYLERLRHFEVREDDIWICTFPKCGTTWTQEMVWCLKNNLDFNTSKTVDLDERMIFIEFIAVVDENGFGSFPDTIQQAADMPSPRIIKTHLPFDLLPDQIRTREKTPKIIHVFRNSRDVCVSYYHHWRVLEGFNGSFDLWSRLFLEGYGGFYFPYWKHVKSYYLSHYENIVFVKYEDMKKDIKSTINALCAFLECKSYTDDEIAQLEEHLSFKNFKQTATLNKDKLVKHCNDIGYSNQDEGGEFLRKGIVGDWKNYFSDKMSEKFKENDAELSRCTGLVIQCQI
jgi:estrone sulfotransferase